MVKHTPRVHHISKAFVVVEYRQLEFTQSFFTSFFITEPDNSCVRCSVLIFHPIWARMFIFPLNFLHKLHFKKVFSKLDCLNFKNSILEMFHACSQFKWDQSNLISSSLPAPVAFEIPSSQRWSVQNLCSCTPLSIHLGFCLINYSMS